jgi:predicted nucleic acid-binding protein
MTKKAFIDTNIFIYAFENEKTPKKKKALKLIKNENIHFITSVQVLNEFVSAAVKKGLLSKKRAIELALLIKEDFEVVPVDSPLFSKAMAIYGEDNIDVSLWDSLIVASAILNQCDTLYSEDMQHQFKIENLHILNPFLPTQKTQK